MLKHSRRGLPVRVLLLSGAASIACTAAARAQDAPSPDQAIGTVIVTARRVAEDIQRVPETVSVVTPDALVRGNVIDSFTLLSQVPSIQNFTRGNPGNATITTLTRIRGVTGVANYFADAPWTNSAWTFYGPFFDLENVQVLEGPQGTLFGQASNAGAVLLQPRKPGNTFGGLISAQAGNYEQKVVDGALDLPIVQDKVLLRVAGRDFFRGGYVRDLYSGFKFGQVNYDVERATLVLKPSSALQNTTLFMIEHDRNFAQVPRTIQMVNMTPVTQNPMAQTQANNNGMTLAQFYTAIDQVLAQQYNLGPYKVAGLSLGCPATASTPATKSTIPGPNVLSVIPQPCLPLNHATSYSLVNTTTLEINPSFSLKNLFSHTWGSSIPGMSDNDESRLILQDSNPKGFYLKTQAPQSWSEELQLIGKAGPLDFVSGVSWFGQYSKPGNPGYAQFFTSLADTATMTKAQNTSLGFYAQGNYDLSGILPGLKATAGIRYNRDYAYSHSYVFNPNTLVITSESGGKGSPFGEARWSAVSYTASLQYQASPKTMFYITNSRGYSSGGLQNVTGFFTYNPDHLLNLEAGVKTRWDSDDLHFVFDVSGFYGRFQDVKVSSSVVTTIPGTTGQRVVSLMTNAASAIIPGVEALVTARYKDFFDFRGYVQHNEDHFTKYPGVNPQTFQPVDLSDAPFNSNPNWKFGLSPTIYVPINRARYGAISVSADFTWVAEYWGNTSRPRTPVIPGNINTQAVCKLARTAASGFGPLMSAIGGEAYIDCVPQWYNLNMAVTWDDFLSHPGLQFRLAVTNVTFNKTAIGQNALYDSGGYNAMESNPPRFVFGTVSYRF